MTDNNSSTIRCPLVEDDQEAKEPVRDELDRLRAQLHDLQASERELRSELEELRTTRWRMEIRLEGKNRQLERLLEAQERSVAAIKSSTSWRITRPLRSVVTMLGKARARLKVVSKAILPRGEKERAMLRAHLRRRVVAGFATISSIDSDYSDWYATYQQLEEEDRALIQAHLAQRSFSPVYLFWDLRAADAEAVSAAISSLQKQLLTGWTADMWLSPAVAGSKVVLDAVGSDARLRCIDQEADPVIRSDVHTVLIDRVGLLVPHALYLLMEAAQRLNGTTVVLADEDELSGEDRYRHPRFVARYSPELPTTGSVALFAPLRDSPDLPQLAAFTTQGLHATVHARVSGEPSPPIHVPFIVFHARHSPALRGTENSSMVEDGKSDAPFISIIIPTRDRFELMEPCISSILQKTDYPRTRYEIVVVDNGSTEVELLNYLEELVGVREIRLIRDSRKFNYARLNNLAAAATQGDLLAFVNNDVIVHDPAWLRRLAFHAVKPTVGAVGAKLLYPDMTVQHGGVILGVQGVAAHAHHNLVSDAPGYLELSNQTRAISAVTGACLMIRRRLFDIIGGFDEDLAVAFNDTLLCMDALSAGFRNICVHHPLLIHFESKSRGHDDTDAKRAIFRREARYVRSRYGGLFKSDPYYSDNLSFEKTYELAHPPRTFKPWHTFRRESSRKMRLLILSITHQVGHGVAVVIDIHARYLAAQGHTVILGGPRRVNDFGYEGCERIYCETPQQAASYAMRHGVDCVIMHTSPFFSTTRWLGPQVKTMVYDHGEPPPDLFPDAETRSAELEEKEFCLEMADVLYANSKATRDDSGHDMMGVIPLGNTHLAQWSPEMDYRRLAIREQLGLAKEMVMVLNVCRFHAAERYYKGIDDYCAVRDQLLAEFPDLGERFVFALVGKGDAGDVVEMEARGLRVFANVTDAQMLDMYCCADIYANFSRWEGYNLGIGQALAMGLEVVASDIPAHRSFPIFTSSETLTQARTLVERGINPPKTRQAKPTPWEPSLRQLSDALDALVFELS